MQSDVKKAANLYVAYVEDHFKGKKIFRTNIELSEEASKEVGRRTSVIAEDVDGHVSGSRNGLYKDVAKDSFKGASDDVIEFIKNLFDLLATYSLVRMRFANPNASKKSDSVTYIEEFTPLYEYVFGVKSTPPSKELGNADSFVASLARMSMIYTNAKAPQNFIDTETLITNVPKILAQLTPGFRVVLKRLWNTNKDMATELAYSPNLATKGYQSARKSFKDAVIDLACVLESRVAGFNEKAKKSRSKSGKTRTSKSCSRSKKKARRSASARRRKQRQKARGGSRLK